MVGVSARRISTGFPTLGRFDRLNFTSTSPGVLLALTAATMSAGPAGRADFGFPEVGVALGSGSEEPQPVSPTAAVRTKAAQRVVPTSRLDIRMAPENPPSYPIRRGIVVLIGRGGCERTIQTSAMNSHGCVSHSSHADLPD